MNNESTQPLPLQLSGAIAGQRVRVSSFEGGRALRARLHSLGLTPGMTVDVLSSNGGPMILNVMGSRLMLGRGLASKINVRVVS